MNAKQTTQTGIAVSTAITAGPGGGGGIWLNHAEGIVDPRATDRAVLRRGTLTAVAAAVLVAGRGAGAAARRLAARPAAPSAADRDPGSPARLRRRSSCRRRRSSPTPT